MDTYMIIYDEDVEADLQWTFAIFIHELNNIAGEIVEWQFQGCYAMLQSLQLGEEEPLQLNELVGGFDLRSALIHQRLIYL